VPRVSIIIPTYNRASLLREALESVFAQTYQDFEVIVVDDGSTDGTGEILKDLLDKVRYIRQENLGCGAARNRGMEEAKGEYIAFLDSDDLWMDFKLELQVAILDKMSDVGFLYSDFQVLKDFGIRLQNGLERWFSDPDRCRSIFRERTLFSEMIPGFHSPTGDFFIYRGNIYRPLLSDPYVSPSCTVVRRSALPRDFKICEEFRICMDWIFFALMSKTTDAAFMDVETMVNRGHRDAVRLTLSDYGIKAAERLKMIERVWKDDPEFIASHRHEVLQAERDQVLLVAKSHILGRREGEARILLADKAVPGFRYRSLEMALLGGLAALPGTPGMLVHLREARRRATEFIRRGKRDGEERGGKQDPS